MPEAKIVLSRPLYAKASGCMGCLAIDSCIQRAREAFDSIAARGDIIFEDVEQNKKVIVDPKKVSEDLAQMIGGFNDAKEQYTQLAQVCRDSDTGKIDLYDEGAVVGYICGATQEEYKITPTES
ncbi:MAG: hypothetical protein JWO47_684 [Candidatus Saccharibacteria bacterium]|nr:hypothetical protein [Candidatus Saccharibacteria bacterium]